MQMQYDYLKVPASEFVGSIDTIVEVISQVTSILSEFADFSGDSRLQDAVSDCLDLLDVSSDELSWSAYASQNPNESMQMQYDYLKVPASEFVGSIDTIVEVISQVTSILSEFADFSGDSRLQDAVSDCLDLLDVSSDELSWSAYASQNPNGTYI
ncbi:hypothetical protein F2Q69_00032949 [Brassica cretica]|uniref:Pectinesterase inhibitor domain-containing protein n=1 Tax=Brassica cretica TaxID=69181 RepID=A0A8S9SFY5_BRACR|nr:hypothetical protein F2Q69_00032949 [Brassica cretica]